MSHGKMTQWSSDKLNSIAIESVVRQTDVLIEAVVVVWLSRVATDGKYRFQHTIRPTGGLLEWEQKWHVSVFKQHYIALQFLRSPK